MTVPSLAITPWEFLAIISVLVLLAKPGRLPELAATLDRVDINDIERHLPRVLMAVAVVALIVLLFSCLLR
jgi:hypothetical protein